MGIWVGVFESHETVNMMPANEESPVYNMFYLD